MEGTFGEDVGDCINQWHEVIIVTTTVGYRHRQPSRSTPNHGTTK